MPLFISTLMTSCRLRLRAFVDALQMASIGRNRAHAFVVARQRFGDGELAASAIVLALFGDRCFGRSLGAFLGDRFFFFFSDQPAAARRFHRSLDGGRIFFLFQPARGLFFRMLARQFVGGLAGVFFGLALFGGQAFALQTVVFDGTIARIFFCALAGFHFVDACVGQGGAAARLLFVRQLTQDDAGTRRRIARRRGRSG
jgi:hypothetical protein